MFEQLEFTGVLLCYGPLFLVIGGFIVAAVRTDANARRKYLRNLDPRNDDDRGGPPTAFPIDREYTTQTPSGLVVTFVPDAAAPSQTEAVAPAAPKTAVDTKPDDLRKIEGIGPKINLILQGAGIRTFRDLANSTAEQLRAILNEANISAINDPTTWPEQAALAADGKWDQLAKLQDNLDGGRRVD